RNGYRSGQRYPTEHGGLFHGQRDYHPGDYGTSHVCAQRGGPASPPAGAGLLALQPGVTSFGSFGSGSLDDRSGSVNGGRSDQSNITLDGADVLSETNRAAFTSVLRVTPDSVEEFRGTTTNGGADTG